MTPLFLRKQFKRILFWAIVLAIAPFFVEIVLVANLMGAEFALFFAAFYYKEIARLLSRKWLEFREEFVVSINILSDTLPDRPVFLASHSIGSFVLLGATGSLVFVFLSWYWVVFVLGMGLGG